MFLLLISRSPRLPDTRGGENLPVVHRMATATSLPSMRIPTMASCWTSSRPMSRRSNFISAVNRQGCSPNRVSFTSTSLFDLDIDYYHIGGTALMGEGKLRPFVVGTLGVTYMAPKGEGLDSVTKFSLSLGGGAKIYFTDHIGLRLEGRWFGTFFDGSGQAFCSSGQCLIKVQGDVFSQFVANAGIIIGF